MQDNLMTKDQYVLGGLWAASKTVKPYTIIHSIKGTPFVIQYSVPYTLEYEYVKDRRKDNPRYTVEKDYLQMYQQIAEETQQLEKQLESEDIADIISHKLYPVLLKHKQKLLREISQKVGVQMVMPEALNVVYWDVGTRYTFPFHIPPTTAWTSHGNSIEQFINIHSNTEPFNIHWLAYVVNNILYIHQPLDVVFPYPSGYDSLLRNEDIKYTLYFFYFPLEWEQYLRQYLYNFSRKNLLPLDKLPQYYHYYAYKQSDDIRYGTQIIEKLVEWAKKKGYSEVWFHPIYDKDGNAKKVQVYGKMGINYKEVPPFISELTPAEFENLIQRFLLGTEEGQGIRGLSVSTLLTHPDTFTLVIGPENIETRWAVYPLGKNPEVWSSIEKTPPQIVIRVYAEEEQLETLDDLKAPEPVLRLWQQLLPTTGRPIPPVGLYVVAGRTDSGKSTLLGLLAKHLYENGLDVAMLEDPIERIIPGVNQTNVYVPPDLKKIRYREAEEEIERFVQNWLDTQLRANPDVVIVGEIRNELMMRKLLQLVKTGKLVLVTVHAGSLIRTLTRLVNLGMSLAELASDLLGISFLSLVNTISSDYLLPLPADKVTDYIINMFPHSPGEAKLILSDIALWAPHLFPREKLEKLNRLLGRRLNIEPSEKYYILNAHKIKGKTFKEISKPERIQVGSHVLLTASIREKFYNVLYKKGLQDFRELKRVFMLSPFFFSMGEHYRLLAEAGLFPLDTAIHNILAYDEVYSLLLLLNKIEV